MKINIREAVSYGVIIALLIGLAIQFNCATSQTKLQQCLSFSKNKGLINDKGKDSAFITKCGPYRREEVIDKYVISQQPKMKYVPGKNGKAGKVVRDLKDGKVQLVPSSKIKLKPLLLYIETGQVSDIE